ncbi:unnamed protein product [Calypogeia fissa]
MGIEVGSGGAIWVAVGGAFLLVVATQWVLWATSYRYRGAKLAKGTYGLPFVGETIQFLRWSCDPRKFVDYRIRKYGSKSFKTHLFGVPTFMTTDPDVASKIYQHPTTVLQGHLPDSAIAIIGPQSYQFAPGKEHDPIHKLISNFMFPQSLTPYVPELENLFWTHMRKWDGKVVKVTDALKKVVTIMLMNLFAGFSHEDEDEELITQIYKLMDGSLKDAFISLPLNLPGTTFNKGLKAREEMLRLIQTFIAKRKHKTGAKSGSTLLDELLAYKNENGEHMSSGKIMDTLMTLLFGGIDSTRNTFALCLKNLMNHPEVLERLKAEHEAIRKAKPPGEPLSIDDLNKMTYTNQVVFETLRNPGGGPFSTRRTLQDVNLGGYHVPKGWNIISFFPGYHFDPETFPDPESFDPAHFNEKKTQKQFSPFGGGSNVCSGRELAKIELKILLHIFLTKFRWEYDGVPSEKLQFYPACAPADGLRLKVNVIEST